MEKVNSLENKRNRQIVYAIVCAICSSLFPPLICITAYYVCRAYSVDCEINSLKKELDNNKK